MLRSRAALALLLACCGCIGIRGGELEQLDRDEIMRGERLPAISYEIDPYGHIDDWGTNKNSELFRSAFVEARRGTATDDLHIALSVHTEEDLHALSIGLRVLCMFSLGLIPAYSQGEEQFVARVESKGQLLHEYRYAERVKCWAHLFLLPGFYTSDGVHAVMQRIHGNMLLHLIRDLRQDLPTLVPASAP